MKEFRSQFALGVLMAAFALFALGPEPFVRLYFALQRGLA